jgi:hypothetical protein
MHLVFGLHIVHGDYRGARAVDGFRSMVDPMIPRSMR